MHNINVQLEYPFFVGGINDSDIDFLASRGEATNGVLKEAILTLHSAVPAKMFRALMRMCNMRAPAAPGPVFRRAPPPGSINNNDFEEETLKL